MMMMQPLFLFCCLVTRIKGFHYNLHRPSFVHFRQLKQQSSPRNRHFGSNDDNNSNVRNVELDKEEPLSVLFQRAVALHRAGELEEALGTYELFLKAAKQCNVSPDMYAEIHVNIGAIKLKQPDQATAAKSSFETALKYRSNLGTAHVNLALLILKELSTITDATQALRALQDAKTHCEEAIYSTDNDARSMAAATKIMQDIDGMISQTGFQ
jgi:tetratricopeptide (TPR) repeat protein